MADYLNFFLTTPDWEARVFTIAEVFTKQWWKRVWALQEIVLAGSATVHYGKRKLQWAFFHIFTRCLHIPRIYEKFVNFVPRSKEGTQTIEALYGNSIPSMPWTSENHIVDRSLLAWPP
jgi:hypothetical protein